MALNHSPRIATSGLVLALDVGNIKSYKGPVMTNSMQFLNVAGTGTASGYSSSSYTVEEFIPTLGNTSVTYNVIQNNYPAVSTNCCPSLFSYSNGFAVSPNTQYTYAIVYKCDSGYTNPNYMYRYEFTSNGGSLVIEQGVHSTTNRVHLGNDWYWAWATFTTSSTTNWIGYMGAFYYRYSTNSDRLAIPKVLLAQGDFTSLHPAYWTNVATSRNNTQSVYDITYNHTVTSTSVSYTNSGELLFNGTSDYLLLNQNIFTNSLPNFSISAWVNKTSDGIVLGNHFGGSTWESFWLATNSFIVNGANNNTTNRQELTFSTPTSSWFNIVAVSNNTAQNMTVYLNGTQLATKSANVVPWNSSIPPAIGAYRLAAGGATYALNGRIANLTVHNRALTASEVYQNYSALKGRYGL